MRHRASTQPRLTCVGCFLLPQIYIRRIGWTTVTATLSQLSQLCHPPPLRLSAHSSRGPHFRFRTSYSSRSLDGMRCWWWPRKQKISSRKFIDLIWKTSNKWAVWDPPSSSDAIRVSLGLQGSFQTHAPFTSSCPQVGDYGLVDPETGKFEFEGNIYRDDKLADIVKDHNVDRDAHRVNDNMMCITSSTAQEVSGGFGASLDAQVSKFAFKVTIRFRFLSGSGLC